MPLLEALTLSTVRTLADEKTFLRGLAYFHEGAVGRLDEMGEEVRADVQGTHRYHIMLAAGQAGGLEYDCDCPVGEGGAFCKHAVAVALAWLESVGEEVFPPPEPSKPKRKRITKADQVKQYLETLTEQELRDILVAASDGDRRLRDKLLFAAKAAAGSDLPSLRALVRQATRTSGFLDWREAAGYGHQLAELGELLEKRIRDGNPKLVEVIEEAIVEAERALTQIDDSNGEVYPVIGGLQQIHQLACECLRPEPVALAERLFRYQMEGEWDTFHNVLPGYMGALGAEGLARYRQLVEEKWTSLAPRLPTNRRGQSWDSGRFRVEHAMEALAKLTGDIDAIAAIKAKDLSSPRRFLDLAVLYQGQERFDEALAWAEKGIAAFRREGIQELLSFALEVYFRQGNKEKVEQLAWDRFTLQMGSKAFFLLLRDAARIGREEKLRRQALAALQDQVSKEESPQKGLKRSPWMSSARSQLVEIFLAEKDSEQAWRTLKGGPTDRRLWDKAAALRGKTHPDEAINLYFQLLPHNVQAGTSHARYNEAVETVRAIRNLRLAQGEKAKFSLELEGIRTEYKAKRNFIKALADLD